MWVYILRSKDQVFQEFSEWIPLVENLSGHSLKTLRSDNGGEYTSAQFTTYVPEKKGVRHEFTVPMTPQQNGVAEQTNWTLVEAVRSILSDAKLPKKFWAEAVSTAVYLRNRSPTSAVQGKTPFEAWTQEKPNAAHLKIFGCLCHAHVEKDERQKFDAIARKYIMLGYGTETKTYQLYDVEQEKVFFSRVVVFNETKCGNEKQPENKSIGHVELECSNGEILKEVVSEPEHQEPITELRRSTREQRQPDYYGERAIVAK